MTELNSSGEELKNQGLEKSLVLKKDMKQFTFSIPKIAI
jgi:hypothetical protein